MTIRAGVAGRPIGHSLSPAIHGAWIEATGLDAHYGAHEPADEDAFADVLRKGRSGGLAGMNVTAPYKEAALAAADQATETARAVGAANLLLFRDGRIRADSTDGEGLMLALAEQAPGLSVLGQAVVILGAGGAARAAAHALAQAGAAVRIVNRTAQRAERLAADIGPAVIVSRSPEAFGDAVLVVNALSSPPDLDVGLLEAGTVVMDMTYRPLVTPLLAEARARGLPTVDGLAMLIGQARPSFRALFGVEPPPAVDVRARALSILGEAP